MPPVFRYEWMRGLSWPPQATPETWDLILEFEEPMEDRDLLLQEREKTHGSFEMNASISRGIKGIFHYGKFPEKAVHQEALDMIALKLSRILSGQADFKDHWNDIAGYAKLAAEACPK